jgi:hypothetical protein
MDRICFRTTSQTRYQLVNALEIIIDRINHNHKVIDFKIDKTWLRLELPLESDRHGWFGVRDQK